MQFAGVRLECGDRALQHREVVPDGFGQVDIEDADPAHPHFIEPGSSHRSARQHGVHEGAFEESGAGGVEILEIESGEQRQLHGPFPAQQPGVCDQIPGVDEVFEFTRNGWHAELFHNPWRADARIRGADGGGDAHSAGHPGPGPARPPRSGGPGRSWVQAPVAMTSWIMKPAAEQSDSWMRWSNGTS